MKFRCPKLSLVQGLTIAGRAATGHTLPILRTIKMTTEQERVLLEATNLEFGIQVWVEAAIDEPGSVALPARLLTDFVGILPHESITIAAHEPTFRSTITSELSEAVLPGTDPVEFPAWPTLATGSPSLMLASASFKHLVGAVAYAASTNERRPAFTGIFIEARDQTITCAAADDFRLAVATVALLEPVPEPLAFLVPAKTLKDIAALLPMQGQVQITVTPSQILFQTPVINMVARLLDAQYPDFRQLLPDSYGLRALLETRLFSSIVKAAALFAQDSTRTVTLTVKPRAGTLTICAQDAEIGENSSTIPVNCHELVDDLTILFNVHYLAEALAALGTVPTIALELRTPAKPGILKPAEAATVLHLIMPMQTKQG